MQRRVYAVAINRTEHILQRHNERAGITKVTEQLPYSKQRAWVIAAGPRQCL